jgi:hypothetical protein
MVWTVIAIATLVAGIFIAIVVRMIINKKKGKTMCSCGGGCSGCPMGDKCGKK